MTFDDTTTDAIFDIMDATTTVQVLQIDPNTGATLATDAAVTCLRRQITTNEPRMGQGGASNSAVKFHLRANTIAFVPKKRDRIVDADGTWVITSVTTAALSTRYVCETSQYGG